MTEEELHIHLERGLARLQREFADTVPAEHVTLIGMDRFEKLIENAKIWDFVPLLVCRQTREALLDFEPGEVNAPPARFGARLGHSVRDGRASDPRRRARGHGGAARSVSPVVALERGRPRRPSGPS
jgi:hypothetical protein